MPCVPPFNHNNIQGNPIHVRRNNRHNPRARHPVETRHKKACKDNRHLKTLPRNAERSTQDLKRRTANNVALIRTDCHTQLQNNIPFSTGVRAQRSVPQQSQAGPKQSSNNRCRRRSCPKDATDT